MTTRLMPRTTVRRSKMFTVLGGALALAAAGLVHGGASVATPAPKATPATAPTAHRVQVHPVYTSAGRPNAETMFSCQDRPFTAPGSARCYTPSQIQSAYSITPLLKQGLDGSDKTIAIVDAYSNPYIAQDLEAFDTTFGLPKANFKQVAPQGMTPFDINDSTQVGWAGEIDLDVQWAHAVAPGAKILLVLAKTSNDDDILNATRYAVEHTKAAVISQSFGEAETCVDPALLSQEHALAQEAVNKGITMTASSGDSGASQFDCSGTSAILAASSPASDPLETGVGGTSLFASVTGKYGSETAWTEPSFGCNPPALAADDINCSGGGFSTLYPKPSYQNAAVPGSERGVPDVSYDAGVNGGVLTHSGVLNALFGYQPSDPLFFIFGGTSSGAPQWAGLIAIADQIAGKKLGNINPTLYSLAADPTTYSADFHDITKGNNDVSEVGGGYDTSTGWDPVTGLGSPIASALLPDLAAG